MIGLENFGDITLLSVEDDEFNQELASAIFEEFKNVTVLQAKNGEEALEILKEREVDIILLDLMMPKMNGFETLEIIKNSDKYALIPVIIVTSEENEKKRTYKLGANDFVSKPYSPTELKMRVANNIKIRRFWDILSDIQVDAESSNAMSNEQLNNLRYALKIADNSQKQLLIKLGNMAHKNGYRDKHSTERLSDYMSFLAKLYGIDKQEIDNMAYSIAIYDIGLLRIDKNKLSNSDTVEYKSHPELGLKVLEGLENSNLIEMAREITISHHENWDGSGFPRGLKGEEISIYVRVVALVDYFDELTSNRCYDSNILSDSDALEVIQRERGVRLDPKLLDIFVDNFDKFLDIKRKWFLTN
ncbi:HD domain protein [hydrothermal vent metagenome]|uniref:HD domain protein n=1 Tax=hydrothermal vent metagenome TaxID=652676 RepID=A0A1W1EI60_9ZZZZ